MRFWDASAIVPLLMTETSRKPCRLLRPRIRPYSGGGRPNWTVRVIVRVERDCALDEPAVTHAVERLKQLVGAWDQVDPSDPLGETGVRVLRVHPLPVADALQLAAVFVRRNAGRRHSTIVLGSPRGRKAWRWSVSERQNNGLEQSAGQRGRANMPLVISH